MRNIIVEPERLEDAANKVEQACNEYEGIYHNLYADVDKMQTSWTGKDNVAYTNQIKSYEEDFNKIALIMKEYVTFLRNSARAYRETQDELYNSAMRLKV